MRRVSWTQPGFVVWNSLQAVWLQATERTESMDRCAEIIQRMQKHGSQPSMVSYGKVLHAAGLRGLGDQALAFLDQYALDSNFPLHHDVHCLNAVLEALTREVRDDAMDRAMAFFEKMKHQDNYAKPDVYSYTILMDWLSRTKGCRHAERGRNLLAEMMQRFQQGDESCRPNAHVVSVVLKLCSATGGTDHNRRRALDTALETFRKCESHFGVSPNAYVYGAVLHAIHRLAASQDQRLDLLGEVFEECRAQGYVSVAAVTIMRKGGASHGLSNLTALASRQVPHRDRPIVRRLASDEIKRPEWPRSAPKLGIA